MSPLSYIAISLSVFCGTNLNSEFLTHSLQEDNKFSWQYYIATDSIIFNEIRHLLSKKMKSKCRVFIAEFNNVFEVLKLVSQNSYFALYCVYLWLTLS